MTTCCPPFPTQTIRSTCGEETLYTVFYAGGYIAQGETYTVAKELVKQHCLDSIDGLADDAELLADMVPSADTPPNDDIQALADKAEREKLLADATLAALSVPRGSGGSFYDDTRIKKRIDAVEEDVEDLQEQTEKLQAVDAETLDKLTTVADSVKTIAASEADRAAKEVESRLANSIEGVADQVEGVRADAESGDRELHHAIQRLPKQIKAVATDVSSRVVKVNARVDKLEQSVDAGLASLNNDLKTLDAIVRGHGSALDNHAELIDELRGYKSPGERRERLLQILAANGVSDPEDRLEQLQREVNDARIRTMPNKQGV